MKSCLFPVLTGILLIVGLPVNGQERKAPGRLPEARVQWADLASPAGEIPVEQFFAGAELDARTGWPWFYWRIPLADGSHVPAYRISAKEVTALPDIFSPFTPVRLPGDWQVEQFQTDAAGVPYLVIRIMPLRERNGQTERLMTFHLVAGGESAPGRLRSGGGWSFGDQSVLAEGTWYKLAIARDGIYRIDRNLLNQLGVNLDELNPQQINIYGNGGGLLPPANSVFRHDDLRPNAIWVSGEQDGTFDSGDYILFYGRGPDSWRLDYSEELGRSRWLQTKHYYSDSAYYFIRIDDTAPLRIGDAVLSDADPTYQSAVFQDYQYLENDLYNLVKSGREFYGDEFDLTTTANYSFSFPSLAAAPASVDFSAVSRSISQPSSFTVSALGQSETVSITAVGTGATSAVARTGNAVLNGQPAGNAISVNVTYNKANPEAVGWLDFLTANATRNLLMTGNQMRFRDTLAAGEGQISRYTLGGAGQVFQVWDVTDPLLPRRVNGSLTGNSLAWSMETDTWREFIAFQNAGYLAPTPRGRVENQNLHGMETPDLVIVSAPGHLQTAEEIAAIHSEEGLEVAIVTPSQVFNEYSSGNPDVTAIRMLMLMFYHRAEGDADQMPRNLLLLGDGNYLDNKGLKAQSGFNVMVFESDNSLFPATSYVSDDYYVLLSPEDTDSPTGLLDCGVGRIPATNLKEGQDYVRKIRRYLASNQSAEGGAWCVGSEEENPFGAWRNLITFVADDQDGNGAAFEQVHLNSSEFLADDVSEAHPEYDISKIFLDAYAQESTPGGERYPEAEKAIRERVQNGTLLVTYIGHGGERGWAHERILDIPTIEGWNNRNRMPVFLTATCELARYDDPSFNSAGEILVMNPEGGAIAMLTTTRIVFSGENFAIDTAFFNVALNEDQITHLDLGRINQLTKNGVAVGNDSKPNFSLLGDPALRMSYPQFNVYTAAINGIETETFADTLKSLQEVEITGYVGDASGNKLTDFNGFVYPSVFDKESQVLTQNNDDGVVQQFQSFNRIIYRGKASVVNGDFTFRFVVPFDINYSVGNGRISYYAVAGNRDAHGAHQQFLIGSTLSGAELNSVGPEIGVFMNDTTFVSGGLTNTAPVLLVRLSDENGINTVGNGIGHDLTAILDGDSQNPIVLNDFYEADLDTYKSGEVRYQLSDLNPGEHSIRIRAWDVHNNSSESTVDFLVAEDAGIALNHVLNYPNPFTTSTSFLFEHNQACEWLDVRVQVFTISGRLVKTLTERIRQSGFRSEPLAWDGRDEFGDKLARGVYVYRLEVRNEVGQRAEQFEKLVILK